MLDATVSKKRNITSITSYTHKLVYLVFSISYTSQAEIKKEKYQNWITILSKIRVIYPYACKTKSLLLWGEIYFLKKKCYQLTSVHASTLIITLHNEASIHNAMHSPTFLSFHVALYPTKQYIRNIVWHKVHCLLYK